MTVLNELSFIPSVPSVLLKCLVLFILRGFFCENHADEDTVVIRTFVAPHINSFVSFSDMLILFSS